MAIPIYLYANGNDPFIFPLGDFIVHVHTGPPPAEAPTVSSPVAPGTAASGAAAITDSAPVTPRLMAYPRKTRVGPPLGLTYVHGPDEMREWLSTIELEHADQPVRFRLDTMSDSSGLEIQTLLGGLQGFSGRDVNVDIVGWSEPGDG
jgi:hypothetical protein